jgi:hypothetical protein
VGSKGGRFRGSTNPSAMPNRPKLISFLSHLARPPILRLACAQSHSIPILCSTVVRHFSSSLTLLFSYSLFPIALHLTRFSASLERNDINTLCALFFFQLWSFVCLSEAPTTSQHKPLRSDIGSFDRSLSFSFPFNGTRTHSLPSIAMSGEL